MNTARNSAAAEKKWKVWRAVSGYFQHVSLRNKMFAMFVIAFLIPNIAVTAYSYHGVRSELAAQATATLKASVRRVSEQLLGKQQLYTALTFNFYLDTTLRNYLLLRTQDIVPYYEAYYLYINRLFSNVMAYNHYIDSITVYPYNEQFPIDGLYVKSLDEISPEDDFYARVIASRGNPVFGSVHKNKDGVEVFSVARLLNHQSAGNPYGILVLSVRCEELTGLITQELRDMSVYIATDTGQIAADNTAAPPGVHIADAVTSVSRAAGRSGILHDTIAGELGIIAYETAPGGWYCVATMPYRLFMGNVNRLLAQNVTVSCVCMALVIAFIFLLSIFMTRRIRLLTASADKLARNGNGFHVQLGSFGSDEIGTLGKAFSHMAERIRILIEEVYQKEIRKEKAELQSLQNQINPHFMYNSLSSIAGLALKNGDLTGYEMSNKLARFYRISLSKGRTVITIREELELCRYFLDVEKVRFENIQEHFEVEDETVLNCSTIKLIAQPFIENAINHGLYDQERPFIIHIRVRREGEDILFIIADNGVGIDEVMLKAIEQEESERGGMGIRNVRDRIRLFYGDDYGVVIKSVPGQGTTVIVRIPDNRSLHARIEEAR